MKSIFYVLLAAVVLEASLAVFASEVDSTTAAPAIKKPKIKRTIRVRENAPQEVAPPAPSGGGATNNVEVNPNISLSMPQAQQPEPASEVAQPEQEEKPEPSSSPNLPPPPPPTQHHHHHHHHDERRLHNQGYQGEGEKTPLFQINISGQESLGVRKDDELLKPVVVPVVESSAALTSVNDLIRRLESRTDSLIQALANNELMRRNQEPRIVVLPAQNVAPSPPQVLPVQQQQPIIQQLPPAMPMGFDWHSLMPFRGVPMQFPMPMPAPVAMAAPPMWPYGPYNFPGWMREPRRKHKKDKKKEKKEEKTTTEAPTTTTTTTAVYQKPWIPKFVPAPIVTEAPTTTTTTTPKPAEEIEWETVRVPKIKRKA